MADNGTVTKRSSGVNLFHGLKTLLLNLKIVFEYFLKLIFNGILIFFKEFFLIEMEDIFGKHSDTLKANYIVKSRINFENDEA